MNTKILAQNIVNNPSDFTAEQIEKYFEDYAELRLSDVIKSVCDQCRFESECRFKAENIEQNCKFFIDKQTVL